MHEVSSIDAYVNEEIAKLPAHSCGNKSFKVVLRDRCTPEELKKYFGNSNAWAKVMCAPCSDRWGNGLIKWLAKPDNAKQKKSRSGAAYYRDYYRQKDGKLKCWLCEDTEDEITNGFEHHHIDWKYETEKDYAPEEVRILCNPCHDILTSLKRMLTNKKKGKINTPAYWCGVDNCPCSINMNCNHSDFENCESRIEVA